MVLIVKDLGVKMDYFLLLLIAGEAFAFGIVVGAILMLKKPVKKPDNRNYYQKLDMEV